jgi:hypothetical protein
LLRGALRQAAALQAGADDGAEAAAEAGPVVCVTRPGAAPDLDAVCPGLGLCEPEPERDPTAGPWVRWQVAAAWQGAPELGRAVDARPGWRWSIGPAAGQPDALAPVRVAAEGEAPDGAGLALWIEAPADAVRAELQRLPAGGPPPKARPPRRRRGGQLRRGKRR